jgi:hypothetical protein
MPLGAHKAALMGVAGAGGGSFEASGGTESTDGDYKIHTFTSSGTFTVTSGSADVEYMVIAGGGGGGNSYGYSGGGGAGGYRTATGFTVDASVSVTIGAGGSQGSDGSDSVFSTITSTGGGSGGGTTGAGSAGGSGGGAGNQSTTYGAGNSGSFSPVEGYRGAVGQGSASDGLGNFRYFGGGGGGSSEYGGSNNEGAGQNSPLYSGAKRDLGGDGTSNDISGSAVTYATGGSANGWIPHRGWPEGGSSADTNPNTGDGGGGGDNHNGGGSGIVIIKYATA